MKAIVFGGAGNLGKTFVTALTQAGLKPICVDIVPNNEAFSNVKVNPASSMASQLRNINSEILKNIGNDNLSCVFSAAGGWRGGSIHDEDFLENISKMHNINVETAAMAAHVASNFVCKNGLLLLTGASAALRPLPQAIGYGISKASTHYIVQSAAVDPVFLSKHIHVLGVLPQVIEPASKKIPILNTNEDSTDFTKVILNFIIFLMLYFSLKMYFLA